MRYKKHSKHTWKRMVHKFGMVIFGSVISQRAFPLPTYCRDMVLRAFCSRNVSLKVSHFSILHTSVKFFSCKEVLYYYSTNVIKVDRDRFLRSPVIGARDLWETIFLELKNPKSTVHLLCEYVLSFRILTNRFLIYEILICLPLIVSNINMQLWWRASRSH